MTNVFTKHHQKQRRRHHHHHHLINKLQTLLKRFHCPRNDRLILLHCDGTSAIDQNSTTLQQ